MTQYDMVEKLSVKCNVTLEEARAALETGEWNMLTATHLLEQEKFRRMQQFAEFAPTGAAAAVQAAPVEATEDAAAPAGASTFDAAADEGATSAHAAKGKGNKAARRSEAGNHRKGQGLRNIGDHIRRLVACGNRNRFEIRKGDEMVLDMPVTALVLALVCAFWVCLPLLVIGLFTGFRYSFGGRELGRDDINAALSKAADAAGHIRQSAART